MRPNAVLTIVLTAITALAAIALLAAVVTLGEVGAVLFAAGCLSSSVLR